MRIFLKKHGRAIGYFIAGIGVTVFSGLYLENYQDHVDKEKALVVAQNTHEDIAEMKNTLQSNSLMLSTLLQDRAETKVTLQQHEIRIQNVERELNGSKK